MSARASKTPILGGGNKGEIRKTPGEISALFQESPKTVRRTGGNKGEILLKSRRPGEISALFGQKSGEISAKFATS